MLLRKLRRWMPASSADRGEGGFTLVEMIIAMMLTLLVSAIFLATLVPFMESGAVSLTLGNASRDVLVVFQKIDGEVRFADAINPAGTGASGARYIEWHTPAVSSPDGHELCTQWRFDPSTRYIEEREWDVGSTPGGFNVELTLAVSQSDPYYPWRMINATSLLNAAPIDQYVTPGAMQQLEIHIIAGNAGIDGTSEIRTSFVGRNSSILSQTNDNNGDGLPDGNGTPGSGYVCGVTAAGGNRA